MEEPQKSYYAIIPANVRYDEDLTPNAKLLYGEITALCNEKGFCWANNQYFSNLYKVSKVSISKWISQLVNKGYISNELIYKQGTKEIEYRYLRIVNEPIKDKLDTPIKDKFKDNNTSINNTVNNTKDSKQLAKLEKARLKKEQEDKIENDFDEYYEYYPKKTGRKLALAAYKKVIKDGFTHQEIMEGLVRYINYLNANNTEEKYIKGSTPFLNQEAFREKWTVQARIQNQRQLNPWEVAAYGEEPGRTSYDDDRSIVQQPLKIEQPKFNI